MTGRGDQRVETSDTSILRVDDVTVAFGGLQANRNVTLTLQPNERVGLIGPNGAGKTTLVSCICGEIQPKTGRIFLNGVNVTRWPTHKRFLEGLGRTFQIANPFPALNALDAVALGPLARTGNEEGALDSARLALARLKIDHFADTPMRSLNTVTTKLVELARLIASDVKVAILDELLAGLVPAERGFVLDVLEEVSAEAGWAVVMIEHLIHDVRRFCPRAIVLREGQIIADGPTAQVLQDEEVIAAYLGSRWAELESAKAAEAIL